MDKIKAIKGKFYDALGGKEARKIMKSFYGDFTPFDLTDKQFEILNSVYVKLVENNYFMELIGEACSKIKERTSQELEEWKIAYVMKEILICELMSIAMTDVMKKRSLSEETIEFFAEYTVGKFLADGTQLAREHDLVERKLKQLESDIEENGEGDYKAEIDELWQFS